jgi:hypothetical protein
MEIHMPATSNRTKDESLDVAEPEVVRLSVNLNVDTARALREYAAANHVSATEAVRRAISVLKYVDDEKRSGRAIQSVDDEKKDKVRELVLL